MQLLEHIRNNNGIQMSTIHKYNRAHVRPFLILSFALLVLVMFLRINMRYAIQVAIVAGSSIMWLPTIVKSNYLLTRQEHNMQTATLIFLLIVSVYFFSGYSKIDIVWYLRTIWWLLSGVLSIFILKGCSPKEKKIYFYYLIAILFVFILSISTQGRALIAEGSQGDASSLGQTWISSMLTLLTGFSFIVVLNVKSLVPRLIGLFFILITLYVNLFVLQRATNFILTIFEIIAILMMSFKNRKVVVVGVFVVIVTFFLMFLTDLYIDILQWVADVVPSERLSVRIQSILFAMQYQSIDEGGGTMAARNDLMAISWNTFKSSFIHIFIGAGDYKHGNTVIGNHSYIIDSLASYGIIGGMLLYQIFKNQYYILVSGIDRVKNHSFYLQVTIVFIVYLLRNLTGKMTFAEVNVIILIFFPLLIEYIQNHNDKYQISKNRVH